jgi:hypothetical protein
MKKAVIAAAMLGLFGCEAQSSETTELIRQWSWEFQQCANDTACEAEVAHRSQTYLLNPANVEATQACNTDPECAEAATILADLMFAAEAREINRMLGELEADLGM